LGLSETDWDLRRYGNKRIGIRVLAEAGPRAEARIFMSGDEASPPSEES
jgi:hypothetical protein